MKEIVSANYVPGPPWVSPGDDWDMVLAFEGLQSMKTEMGTHMNMTWADHVIDRGQKNLRSRREALHFPGCGK